MSSSLPSLAGCPLFRGIPPGELQTMLACLKPVQRTYRKNELVTRAGEKFTGIGVVLSGHLTVTRESMGGQRVIITALEAGDLFGEIIAFAGEQSWPATVLAQDECRVLFLPPEKIVGSCEKQCSFHRLLITNMLGIVSRRALLLSRKVEYLSLKSIRGRIAAFLLEQMQKTGQTTFILPFTRHVMADFLNVARPSLSREMGRLRDEGVIDFHRSSVRILDVPALQKMLE
ncbi:MAG: Crp/Fnr family transcriptional regulator [Desulfurispora sp.]|uniref:Crp/Fnr family transcriptional regulator n=1 Tax=Desulfurispora sp. TaxID=3014275 RepID=UPI00404911D4